MAQISTHFLESKHLKNVRHTKIMPIFNLTKSENYAIFKVIW